MFPVPVPDHSGSLYLVTWDDQVHRIWGFTKAREFLLNELMWLYEDYGDELAKAAFDKVLKWEFDGGFPKRVRAGVPPTEYEIRMVG